MLYIIPSLLIESSLGIGKWVIRKSIYGMYCGVYYIIYGKQETIEDKLEILIEKEKRQDKLLIEAIDKLNMQELELSMLKNNNIELNSISKSKIDDNDKDDFVFIL